MPPLPDHYATLGVAETASAKEIKAAYRRLAQQYHPDRTGGDAEAEERFKEVQSAYDVLGDADKRKAYDRQRRDPFGGMGGPTPGFGGGPSGGPFYRAPDGTYVRVDGTGAGPGGGFSFDEGGGLGDLFGQMFGGAFGGGGPRREGYPRGGQRTAGRDVDATMELTFEEALRGGPSQ
ncbi:MAG: DnaJ domain-containing protein, partial [Bacteroidota bacterium]